MKDNYIELIPCVHCGLEIWKGISNCPRCATYKYKKVLFRWNNDSKKFEGSFTDSLGNHFFESRNIHGIKHLIDKVDFCFDDPIIKDGRLILDEYHYTYTG